MTERSQQKVEKLQRNTSEINPVTFLAFSSLRSAGDLLSSGKNSIKAQKSLSS